MKRIFLTLVLMCSIGSYISATGQITFPTYKCEKTGKEFVRLMSPTRSEQQIKKECETHCQGPCAEGRTSHETMISTAPDVKTAMN